MTIKSFINTLFFQNKNQLYITIISYKQLIVKSELPVDLSIGNYNFVRR
jgi:hypothetical protein